MRQIRTSGSMSGRWKRGMAGPVWHRRTKGPATERYCLTHRATSRLYSQVGTNGVRDERWVSEGACFLRMLLSPKGPTQRSEPGVTRWPMLDNHCQPCQHDAIFSARLVC